MPTRQTLLGLLASLAFGLLWPAGLPLRAEGLEPAVRLEQAINEEAAGSQQRVSELARQTEDLLLEYRTVLREIEALRVYNDNLERVVVDQRGEIQSIDRQLAGLEDTNRDIVPLILEMIDMLEGKPMITSHYLGVHGTDLPE